jgi:hypothetical protein
VVCRIRDALIERNESLATYVVVLRRIKEILQCRKLFRATRVAAAGRVF